MHALCVVTICEMLWFIQDHLTMTKQLSKLCPLFDPSFTLAAKPPKITFQPTSQKDAIPGKAVTFSVQATGTEPLGYKWQWKQFGKKDEKDRWQNVPGEGSTFQVRGVKASHAGYYRCVVSNSAGSETSQHASLTVGRYIQCSHTCSCENNLDREQTENCCGSCLKHLNKPSNSILDDCLSLLSS